MEQTYSKGQVDRAGRLVVEPTRLRTAMALEEANAVIEWWRGAHMEPLANVAANLASYIAQEGTLKVSQRLKRTQAIDLKLERQPQMRLSQMADIGGVRAVLPNQPAAYRVAILCSGTGAITHLRDYVAQPKSDGFRALHLVDRNHGPSVEIQLRTPPQDSWANLIEYLSCETVPGLSSAKARPSCEIICLPTRMSLPNPTKDYARGRRSDETHSITFW